jgi:endonuclease G
LSPVCPALASGRKVDRVKRRRRRTWGVWQWLSAAVFVAVIALIVLQAARRPATTPPSAEVPHKRVAAADNGPFQAPPNTQPTQAPADTATPPRHPANELQIDPAIAKSPHVALGIPTDADPSDDVLLDHGEYVVSYNPKRNDPNWAAWQLNASYLGNAPRKNNFRADRLLPTAYYRVTTKDYVGSGYDRAHLCPSADRSHTADQNAFTFLMTNMQPQLHELNAGPWEKMEEYERTLAKRPGAELYIAAGGIFAADPPTIGHGVAVPSASYKVIAVLQKGQSFADVTRSTEIIAVIMPNLPGVGEHEWTDFIVPVDYVESETGYDFFNRIAPEIQAVIESRRAAAP